MDTIFDMANIATGILLGITVLDKWDGDKDYFTKISTYLTPYQIPIGFCSLVLGILFIVQPGCLLYDALGITSGILLTVHRLTKLPSVGSYLEKFSVFLAPYQAIIGVAVLIGGFLGLINSTLLC